uniref:Uncharacterized protein n=1 Tax=Leptobrachium leishanense TaxID=445787 RepID=A0A8C5LPA7_9ANUR
MVRGKKSTGPASTPRRATITVSGPLDDFLHPSQPRAAPAACSFSPPKMAAARPPMDEIPNSVPAIERLERMVAALPTRSDLTAMMEDFRTSLQTELREVRTEVADLTTRTDALERRANLPPRLPASLEDDFSEVRRRLDDLDNRSRRHNVCIRGLPETVSNYDLGTCIHSVFLHILGDPAINDIPLDRCHRALRPVPPAGAPPRDVICRITSYALKDRLMTVARTRREWEVENYQLELFHDLSPFTLAAQRALRPVTQLLRQRQVPYRWGFPFLLQVRLDGTATTIRRQQDVPVFLLRLALPSVSVSNWEAGGLTESPANVGGRPRHPPHRLWPRRAGRSRSPSPDAQDD